jgi:hypothetical protein
MTTATIQLDVTIPKPAATDGAAALSEKDVAAMLNLSRDTVRAMQLSHDGPTYTQHEGCIRYRLADVLKYQALRAAAHKRLMDSFGKRYLPC